MNIYELSVKKEGWDKPEIFYIQGNFVFVFYEDKGLERISLTGVYGWNMREGGNVSLRKLKDKEYQDVLKKIIYFKQSPTFSSPE